MSTKATIAYGPDFHLYHEVLDEQYVYLRLEGTPFEASYNTVTVSIPVHIWEVIRQYEGVDLSFAEASDEELRTFVEEQVDERRADYEEADEDAKNLVRVLGSIPFGTADKPREEQIQKGMDYYQKKREYQRQIMAAVRELRCDNRPPDEALPWLEEG